MLPKLIHNILVLSTDLFVLKLQKQNVKLPGSTPKTSNSLQQRYCTLNGRLSRQQNPSRLKQTMQEFDYIWQNICEASLVQHPNKLTPWTSPSWVANSISANRGMSHILRNTKVSYTIYRRPSHAPIHSKINPVHALPSYFFKIHINIILLYIPTLLSRGTNIWKTTYNNEKF